MTQTKPTQKHWTKPDMVVVHMTEARAGGTTGPIDGISVAVPPGPLFTFAS